MPYREPGPPCCPPPPINPVDSSIDIKLKVLEGKVVPKNTGELPVIPNFDDIKHTDYIYVSDDAGILRKLAVEKIAGKEALAYTRVFVTTNETPDIPYNPTDKAFKLNTADFNREPVEDEVFSLYIKVLKANQGKSAFWLITARVLHVHDEVTFILAKEGFDLTSEIIDDVMQDIQPILDTKISATQEEPTADNPDVQPVLVLLDHEPAAKYKGYFYIIGTDSDPSYIDGTTIELGDESYVDSHIVRFGGDEAIENHTILL